MTLMGVYRQGDIFMKTLKFKYLNFKPSLRYGESLSQAEEEVLSILSVNFLGIFCEHRKCSISCWRC